MSERGELIDNTNGRAGRLGRSESAGYSGKPTAVKLGLRAGQRILLLGAPPGWSLDELPAGVSLRRRDGGAVNDVILAFSPDRETLRRRFAACPGRIGPHGALWIAWPKRASGWATDLDENAVRAEGLASGLVDVKVIAIDGIWSGLKFVRRLRDR